MIKNSFLWEIAAVQAAIPFEEDTASRGPIRNRSSGLSNSRPERFIEAIGRQKDMVNSNDR